MCPVARSKGSGMGRRKSRRLALMTVAMAHCHITQRELLPCYSLTSMGEDLSRSRTGSHSGVLATLAAISKCTSERIWLTWACSVRLDITSTGTSLATHESVSLTCMATVSRCSDLSEALWELAFSEESR